MPIISAAGVTGFNPLQRLDRLLTWVPLDEIRRPAFERVAAAHLGDRRYGEADAALTRALKTAPNHFVFLFSYALSANDRGLFADALGRWENVLRVAPDNAICWCGVAANLRSLNALDRAGSTIERALERFPNDPCVRVEAARIATVRFELETALRYWDEAIALCEPHPDWLFGRADTLLKMRRLDEVATALQVLRERDADHCGLAPLQRDLEQAWRFLVDELPVPVPVAIEPDTVAIATDALFADFESLGDNCEFGLVQRYNHIEPLGLFRFSSATAEGLTKVFVQRFEDCGAQEDLELLINDTDKSYDCRSIAYNDFRYHTEVFEWDIEPDVLLRREVKKVAYLKKRFMSDMTTAEKIFVRKGGRLEHNMAMFRAMRSYGPVTLLWVDVADDHHPAGTIERVEDGLLKGYIARFAPYGNAHDIDMVGWAQLCCKALSIHKAQDGDPSRHAIEWNIVHRMGVRWAFTDLCTGSDVAEPTFPQGITQRLVLDADTSRDNARVAARFIDHELGPRAQVVFSLWVWIPETFQGTFVDVYFSNTVTGFVSQADLARRGCWQRVWTSTRLPKSQTNAAVGLRITGRQGDTIYIGAWRLEAGALPNPWDLEPAAASRAAA